MRITPTTDGFLLETSTGSITLTLEDALGIVPLAHQIQDLRKSLYPRRSPVFEYAIHETAVTSDPHQTQVSLRLVGPDGLELAYALPLQTAVSLRDALTRKIEQIETAAKTRNTQ